MKQFDDIEQLIDDYLNDALNLNDRKQFEERLNQDSDLQRLVALNKQMRLQYSDNDWDFIKDTDNALVTQLEAYFKSYKGQKDKDLLQKINAKYKKEDKPVMPLKRYAIVGIAASLLIVFGYVFFNKEQSNSELYSEYSDWSNLPSLVTKEAVQNKVLADAETAFINEDYKTAISNFENYLEQQEDVNANVLIYYGLSQLELNKHEQSIKIFDQLLRSNSIDKSKGYWYKALVYLKIDDRENAKKELRSILKDANNFNYNKAQDLLANLN